MCFVYSNEESLLTKQTHIKRKKCAKTLCIYANALTLHMVAFYYDSVELVLGEGRCKVEERLC